MIFPLILTDFLCSVTMAVNVCKHIADNVNCIETIIAYFLLFYSFKYHTNINFKKIILNKIIAKFFYNRVSSEFRDENINTTNNTRVRKTFKRRESMFPALNMSENANSSLLNVLLLSYACMTDQFLACIPMKIYEKKNTKVAQTCARATFIQRSSPKWQRQN